MQPTRSLGALALAGILLFSAVARADIAPPLPLVLRVGAVTAIADGTSASEADVQRTIGTVRTALRAHLRDVERCARGVHGGFAWRSYEPGRARVRATWDRAESPREVTVLRSDFAADVGECFRTQLRAVVVSPAPAGRVTLAVTFARE